MQFSVFDFLCSLHGVLVFPRTTVLGLSKNLPKAPVIFFYWVNAIGDIFRDT